jgi:hypothetical protein
MGEILDIHQADNNKEKYVHCILLCLKINTWDCVGAVLVERLHASTSGV